MQLKACALKDIPAFGNMDSPYAKLITEFLDSGADAAEVDTSPYGLSAVANTLRRICYSGKVPVRVMQRSKRLFLVRSDLEKEAKQNA